MNFKAGKYIIADLCYVVPSEYWIELCNKWYPNAHDNNIEKDIVTYFDHNLDKNVECYALGTAHGDGTYVDNLGNEYDVDAGMIGIIASNDVRKQFISDNNVFDFEHDFEVFSDNGVLYFCNIIIDTNWDDDYDYDEGLDDEDNF